MNEKEKEEDFEDVCSHFAHLQKANINGGERNLAHPRQYDGGRITTILIATAVQYWSKSSESCNDDRRSERRGINCTAKTSTAECCWS